MKLIWKLFLVHWRSQYQEKRIDHCLLFSFHNDLSYDMFALFTLRLLKFISTLDFITFLLNRFSLYLFLEDLLTNFIPNDRIFIWVFDFLYCCLFFKNLKRRIILKKDRERLLTILLNLYWNCCHYHGSKHYMLDSINAVMLFQESNNLLFEKETSEA